MVEMLAKGDWQKTRSQEKYLFSLLIYNPVFWLRLWEPVRSQESLKLPSGHMLPPKHHIDPEGWIVSCWHPRAGTTSSKSDLPKCGLSVTVTVKFSGKTHTLSDNVTLYQRQTASCPTSFLLGSKVVGDPWKIMNNLGINSKDVRCFLRSCFRFM